MNTDKGWTRYDISVAHFDFSGEEVEHQEHVVYDYELGEEALAVLDDICSPSNNDTPSQEAQP